MDRIDTVRWFPANDMSFSEPGYDTRKEAREHLEETDSYGNPYTYATKVQLTEIVRLVGRRVR